MHISVLALIGFAYYNKFVTKAPVNAKGGEPDCLEKQGMIKITLYKIFVCFLVQTTCSLPRVSFAWPDCFFFGMVLVIQTMT